MPSTNNHRNRIHLTLPSRLELLGVVDKIVEGRMNKFFKEAVLLEQAFIKDDKQSVKQMLDAAAKELGDTIAPVHFFRFAIGGD